MRNKVAMFVGISVLMVPFVSSADTAVDLKAQLQGLLEKITALKQELITRTAETIASAVSLTGTTCPALTRTLAAGASGDDVKKMQAYLKSKGYFSGEATGYFGPVTAKAVGAWQADVGLAGGDGTIGPRTRAFLADCADTPASGTPAVGTGERSAPCADVPQPTAACGSAWQKRYTNSCVSSWYCASPLGLSNQSVPPIVSGISGPTSLIVGTVATYRISASGQGLTYNISWGDENQSAQAQLSQLAQTFSSANSASHAYASSGIYTITATVQDASGNKSVSTVSVTVGSATSGAGSGSGSSGTPTGLVLMGADNKCPSGTIPIAVGGYCYSPSLLQNTLNGLNLCPSGMHITAAMGCAPNDTTQTVAPLCANGYFMTAANGCQPKSQ